MSEYQEQALLGFMSLGYCCQW